MEQSPRLSLSYVAPSQAQKHVTVNETFRRLDALSQLSVLSQTVTAEPGAPAEGDAYILPASPTGATWASYSEDDIAVYQDGAWAQIAPIEGLRAWVDDDGALAIYDGANWISLSEGGATKKFGINASADATNRLSVKADAVLFSHDDVTPGNDDCLVKINKKAAADTGSVLFQTNFSGRAEFGLTGDDDFHVKVSANGSSWTDAAVIDKDNGKVGLGVAAPIYRLDIEDAAATLLRVRRSSKTVNDAATIAFWFNDSNDAATQYASLDAKIVTNTAGSEDGRFVLATVRSGVSLARMQIQEGVLVGNPTGGDKGAGALNAQAVYDDNALLTCYVFDQALDGAVDIAKWDAKVPDRYRPAEHEEQANPQTGETRRIKIKDAVTETRRHIPLRKFAARIATEYDPLTLDGYAKHWKEKRHLTAMPNEATFDPAAGMAAGEWIQRLVETVEIQAVLIETLNQRVKIIESALGAKPA